MTRTVNSNAYDGITRTAQITEITTKSEDLSTLAGLYGNLSAIEHRISEIADISSAEGVYLIAERARLNGAIADMVAIIDGYEQE